MGSVGPYANSLFVGNDMTKINSILITDDIEIDCGAW